MMTDTSFRIDGDRLRFIGIDFGYGDSDPFLIGTDGGYFVSKRPSTRDWNGIGSSCSSPAEWCLFRAEEESDGFRVRDIVEERTPGRRWKACRDELLARMAELAKAGEVSR